MELTIRNISKCYAGGIQALSDIDLTIGPGMFGLLGPNGAGKSTLMRTLATLQDPDQGSITLGEIDVLRDPDGIKRVLGYLPQEFGLYPRVSAQALLDHFAVLKGLTDRAERRSRVEELLHLTNLWDARRQPVGGFSGGMKRRLGIAQAVLGNPRLIIVDEPTAGLDPEERARFHNLLAEIGEQTIVILSTHIVGDVSDLCTDMAILDKGRLLLRGRPGDHVRATRDLFWRRFVDRSELSELEEKARITSKRLIGGRLRVHAFGEVPPDEGFESHATRLEDVYFATIKGWYQPS